MAAVDGDGIDGGHWSVVRDNVSVAVVVSVTILQSAVDVVVVV